MTGPRRMSRHHRLGSPGLPSVAAWEDHNRTSATEAKERAITRLACQERGCKEGLATLELDPDAASPRLRLAIHAPWINEPTDDPRVLHRVRLRGATDQTSDAVFASLAAWSEGSRIELICRHGHESRFGAGHLARRLRAVLE